MSQYQYLQLQPVEPDVDDSPLDDFTEDDVIDLTDEDDEEQLDREWARVMSAMEDDNSKNA